ncbi:MAG: calcium-binding protein, partial [Symploca sp. SIO1A3]|nr:calcium-binding protein [Symploca sp. SIO1A3]
SLDGSNGFRINGEAANDYSGWSVSGAGDINGDGIDDLIIGAFNAENTGDSSGSSYVVFGTTDGFNSTFELSSLDGNNGFRIDGEAAYDNSGFAVSGAGDINGDGIDDLIIGAFNTSNNGTDSGSSYVVFGRASNQDPVANDDSFTANQDTALTIPVAELLANDSDSDGDNLSITAVANSTGGTVILDNSNLIFTPDVGFSGTASFEYILDDGNGGSDSATVTVEVGQNITGGNGDDTIDGTNGNDVIDAGNGDDIVNGLDGDDSITGGNAEDLIDGGNGNDIILGGNSKDTLFGGAGDDSLDGGNGADELTGGSGNDTLTGGNGQDLFIFAAGDGTDTITDFGGVDRIGLLSELTFSDLSFSGNDIIVSATNEVLVTLTGVDATTLTASDFVVI